MSKTAREVIAECSLGPDTMAVDHLIESLDAAGFVIVPKEPTPEMITAADKSDYKSDEGVDVSHTIGNDGIAIIYRAMITAAQNPK